MLQPDGASSNVTGAVVSIMNGPSEVGAAQLPALSLVARLKYHVPSARLLVLLIVSPLAVVVVYPVTSMSSQLAFSAVLLTDPENLTRTVPPTGSA